jgi:hypothetical protein
LEAIVHFPTAQWISLVLGICSVPLMFGLVTLMARKKRAAEFPIFVSYLIFAALVTMLGIAGFIYTSCLQYAYLYWVVGFLFVALEFLVMYEVFSSALKPYSALIDLGKMLFGWASVFLLIAASLTAFATAGSHQSKLIAAGWILERSMRLIECGLLLLFFLFEKKLGLSWKTPSISIALGLGCSAAVDLAASYLKTAYMPNSQILDIVNVTVYIGILGFWGACMALPRTERNTVLDSPNRLIFQRWNEVLINAGYGEARMVASASVDSFLPAVEKTVERVMARKMVN